MQLYHITHKSNVESIYDHGIQPKRAIGAEHKVWLVDHRMLVWAIAHCANRHHCLIEDLMVIPVFMPISLSMRTKWIGVYTSNREVHANNHPRYAKSMLDIYGLTKR